MNYNLCNLCYGIFSFIVLGPGEYKFSKLTDCDSGKPVKVNDRVEKSKSKQSINSSGDQLGRFKDKKEIYCVSLYILMTSTGYV